MLTRINCAKQLNVIFLTLTMLLAAALPVSIAQHDTSSNIISADKHALLYMKQLYISKQYEEFITTLHSNDILNDNSILQEDKLGLLNMASCCFAFLKKYDSAYLYKKKYSDLRDSIQIEKNAPEITTLYKQYNVAQKQHEIDKLENERKQGVIFTLLITLILLAGIFILYAQSRTKEKQLQQQIIQLNTAIQYHIYELEEKAKSARVEERKRLGMELHDDLAGILAAIKHKTDILSLNMHVGAEQNELKHITGLMNEAYNKARNKSHEWYKIAEESEESSFSERVKLILKDTLPANINKREITIDGLSLREISLKTKIELLQIIKESVINILKHAKASKISLLLYGETDEVILKINDDGKGFDSASPSFKPGLGLKSIYHRVEKMHGKINFISSPDSGTELNVTLPITTE